MAVPTSGSAANMMLVTKTTKFNRVSPDLLELLNELKLKTEKANIEKATVTVEELGEAPVDADTGPDDKEE